jgi:TonB-linked SusC/RagA family outer membrane protein
MMKNFKLLLTLCTGLICSPLAEAYSSSGIKKDVNETLNVQQKKIIISGIVTDAAGVPLIGATVSVSGSSIGSITDKNGHYTISVNSSKARLTFSYIGYQTIQRTVGSAHTIDVVMQEDSKALDEVVVVGYGIQKRRDLAGAVDQIKGDKVSEENRMYVTRALEGKVPGLNIVSSDGKPSHGGSINVRGTGSIGSGGSALILIDGAEGDISTLNPRDIESVSVLKDASSCAIYGARGCFGVILVTTKKPNTGKVTVTYNGSVSALQRHFKPDIESDALKWTNDFIESYEGWKGSYPTSVNNVFPFSTDYYTELVKRHNDPTLERMRVNSKGLYEYFGNTNWLDLIYKNWTYGTEHNITVSGGGDNASFYVSGRYWGQNGIYSNSVKENYSQYNFRAKGLVKINKWLTLENNSFVVRRIIRQPMVMYDSQNITRQIEQQGYPMTMPKNIDGTWTEAGVYIGWAGFTDNTSYHKNWKFDWTNTTTLTYNPVRDLILKADYTYRYSRARYEEACGMYTYWTGPTSFGQRNTYSYLKHASTDREYMASNVTANYVPTFKNKDHYLNAIVGWNLEMYQDNTDGMYRRGLEYLNYPTFALMDGDMATASLSQSGTEWSYVGLFFRTNYSYKDRYLFEVSGRYDGSSKFPTKQKWGFFPSGSVAWRISNEPFMKTTKNWLDNLKVRFSIGTLGNGAVTPYSYQALMGNGTTSALIDGTRVSYISQPNTIPDNLTWEKSTTYDVGLDFDMLQNRLSFSGDAYVRWTSNMYTVGPELPDVFGASSPKGNYANMKTPGIELSLSWRNQFQLFGKPFKYDVKAMYWDSYSEITKYNNPNKSLSVSSYYKGARVGDIWGWVVEGLFKDQADIDAHANQTGYFKIATDYVWKPGDIKFKDLDDSKTIDLGENRVGSSGDRKIIGNTTPRYRYGLNLGAEYCNFNLSLFFQGVGKRNWWPHNETAFFWGQYNRPYSYQMKIQNENNRWTEENQNVNAYWPRLRGYAGEYPTHELGSPSDKYLQNAGYLRLKNLTFGYTFTPNICHMIGLERLSLVFTADNLWTYSPMFKHTHSFDPENIGAGDTDFRSSENTDGDGYGYPNFVTYTFGINVTF